MINESVLYTYGLSDQDYCHEPISSQKDPKSSSLGVHCQPPSASFNQSRNPFSLGLTVVLKVVANCSNNSRCSFVSLEGISTLTITKLVAAMILAA